jgi:uncharacterized repeat protein (TIGR01451 family)
MPLSPLSAVAEEDADLSLSHTASPSPATAMATLTYSMNIFNNGPAIVATGVTVTDTLPAGLTLVSATFTLRGGVVSAPCTGTTTITCPIGNLTLGGGAAVVIVVTPQGPGEFSNTATVSANEVDPDSSNNTATAVTIVVPGAASPPLTDLHLALRTVVQGLREPTSLAFLGLHDLLVTEKSTGEETSHGPCWHRCPQASKPDLCLLTDTDEVIRTYTRSATDSQQGFGTERRTDA